MSPRAYLQDPGYFVEEIKGNVGLFAVLSFFFTPMQVVDVVDVDFMVDSSFLARAKSGGQVGEIDNFVMA